MAGRIGNEGYSYFSEQAFKNLEKAIDLLIKYNNIQQKGAKDGTAAIQNQIELSERYKAQLKAMGVDINTNVAALQRQYEFEKEIYESKKKQLAIDEKQKQQEKRQRQENRNREESNRIARKWEKEFQDLTSKNSAKEIENQKKLNKIREEAINKTKNLKLTEQQRQDIINKYVKEYKDEQRRQESGNKADTILNSVIDTGALKDIKDGTYFWKLGVQTFKKAVDTFKDAVGKGIDKNYNTAQDTLNKIVANSSNGGKFTWNSGSFSFGGRSYAGFQDINNAYTDQLEIEGLTDNISNTDAIKAMADLINENGLSYEDAMQKGYQDTIIKYIVPYLDTSSEAFNNLEMLLPGMSKNVAAINIATRNQFGESRYLTKYSEQLIELMKPVALQADKELYSDTYDAIVQQAEAMIANNELNPENMQEYVNKAFELYRNPVGTLQSGRSVGDMMTVINTMQNGGIDNPAEYLKQYRNVVRNAYAGNDTIHNNIVELAWGLGTSFRDNNFSNADKTDSYINSRKTPTEKTLTNLYNEYTKNANDFNTTTDQWSKWFENMTTELGDLKTGMGNELWEVGRFLLDGIGTAIELYVVKSVVGKMAESITGGTAGKGLMSAIGSDGSAGTVLGSLIPIASAVAVIAGINAGVQDANEKTALRGEEAGAAALKGTQWENNTTINALSKSAFAAEDRNFMENGWNNMTGGIGFGWSMVFQGKGAQNKNLVQWIMSSDTFSSNPESFMQNAAVLGIMMDQIGYFEDFKRGMEEAGMPYWKDAKAQDLVDYLVSLNYKKKDIDNSAKSIIKAGWMPVMGNGKRLGSFSFDSSKYGLNGQEGFRQGLPEVPYDNYLASLHQGEAVLTASTANELRNLLDEYRNNTRVGVNLDVIIQQQTVSLCNKLDEVIRAISMSNVQSIPTASAEYQARAHNILRTSMLTMRNSKDALN